MTWHAQPTAYTLRLYPPGRSYASRDPYTAVAQVEVLGAGRAYVHATLRADGGHLTREDWRDLGALLMQHGVSVVVEERRGRLREINLARALRT